MLLSKEDLDYITPYLEVVSPTSEKQAFVTESKRALAVKIRRRNWIIAGIIVLFPIRATEKIVES